MKRLASIEYRAQLRQGVTLTEVLMSLMIMSIGISSVAVLFPLSMLRSLQATQLTNAALLKLNVERIIEERPELIFDPDGDSNLVEHFRTPASRNYMVDPNGHYTMAADGLMPNTPTTAPRFDQFGNGRTPMIPRFGGGVTTLQGVFNAGAAGALDKRALQLGGQSLASNRDGWTTIVDAVPTDISLAGAAITLSPSVDLSDVPSSRLLMASIGFDNSTLTPRIADPENFQIVLFAPGGKFSQAYPLIAVDSAANRVTFSEDINLNGMLDNGEDFNGNGILDRRPLPVEFGVPPVVERVLIQSRRVSDFTWMLAVRRRGDGAVRNLDVVIKFSDGVDPATEQLYAATFVNNSNVVGVVAPASGPQPKISKGQYICDVPNARWYRIQAVEQQPLLPSGTFDWGTYTHRVFLETEAKANYGSDSIDGVLNGNNTAAFGSAMFPPGIVEVYPMGSIPFPGNAD